MAQQGSGGGGGTPQMLIRPEHLDRIPSLDAQKKAQYKTALAHLWQLYDSNPAGTAQHHDAETKIRNASSKILAEMTTKPRPGSSNQPPAQPRPGTAGQPAGPNGQAGAAGAGGAGGGAAASTTAVGGAAGAPNAPGQQGNAAQSSISPQVRAMLAAIQVQMPSTMSPQQQTTYRQRWYHQAASELTRREQATAAFRTLTARHSTLQQQGAEIPPQLTQQLEVQKKIIRDAESKFSQMKLKNEEHGRQFAAQAMQSAQNPQVNAVQNAAKAEGSPQQPQGNFQQPTQPAQPGMPATAVATHPTAASQPQQTPQSTTQQSFPPGQYPAQHGAQQPQRPQMNTQMSSQQGAQAHAPAPNNAAPTQQVPQRPQALTQQAAISQADIGRVQPQQNMQPQSNQPQAPQAPGPNGLPFNNVPQSATAANTPTSAFAPNMQPTQPPTNKFPISKQLQLDPRTQQPVQGPPSRPTLGNAGMMPQPGNVRPQPFTLEGEGDRVLSKRKLDELVRQVTGRTAADELEPAVEEALLDLADDFVDDLITSACRLAKLRPAQTLDLKDLQLVLERNYGIRIPGYSLDEVRTVRKFQPAPGWQSKMQAIQTAKTLGGVGGKGDA
nr:transcription initiation factor tfiid subunit 12 [Quercus suber]